MSGQINMLMANMAAAAGGGIGTQTQSDDFNRSDQNPLAGNWTADTTETDKLQLLSNGVTPINLGVDCAAFYTGAWGNDQFSAAKITTTGGTTDGPGVMVRHSTTASVNTYYRCVMATNGFIELGRKVAGVYTSLATRSVTYVAGTELGVSVSGTTLKIWYNNVQQGADVTDAIIASGSPGLCYSSTVTTAVMDDWRGGTVP